MTDLPDEQKNPSVAGSSVSKEREFLSSRENVRIVEVGKVSKTEAETEELVQRLEKEAAVLPQSIRDEKTGVVLVDSSEKKVTNIVIPLKREVYLNPKNWHRPMVDGLRWLLAWTQRIVKMHPQEVVFENDTNS